MSVYQSAIHAKQGAMRSLAGPGAYAQLEVIVVQDGTGSVGFAGQSHPIRPGDVAVLPAGTPHTLDPDGQLTMVQVWVDAKWLEEIYGWSQLPPIRDHHEAKHALEHDYPPTPVVAHPPSDVAEEIQDKAARLARQQAVQGPSPQEDYRQASFEVEDLLGAIAPLVAADCDHPPAALAPQARPTGQAPGKRREPRPLPGPAQAVKAAIDADWDQPLTLEDLAARACVSRSQAWRSFRSTFGQTPNQYQTGVRVGRAAEMLRDTDHTVGHIARSVGWRDTGHATRKFTEATGLPPGAYRHDYHHRRGN
jgi:AraC-like DNA-binding protein